MGNSFRKKIRLRNFILDNWFYLLPIVLLLIFIFSIVDRNYYIGGDLIFPLKPENNILKSIFLWEEENGGLSFFKYMRLFWQILFYIPYLLHIPPDIGIKIFITLFHIVGFVFSYLTYRLIFKDTKYDRGIFALVAATVFILNPSAILVVIGFHPLYSFPACAFFLLKYLERRNLFYLLPFSIFFNIGYLSDLPQAKNFVVFLLAFAFLVLLYKEIKEIKLAALILPLLTALFLTFLLNSVVLFPFIRDAFGEGGMFSQYSKAVTVYNAKADLYSAALPFTTRFYNSNLVNSVSKLGQSLNNPLFIIWTFFLWILILLSVFLATKRERKNIYLLLASLIPFFFLAKGANPPFGEFYKFLLFNLPLFKIFRTTSTVVVAGALFFALLISLAMYYIFQKKKSIFYLILLVHILVFHSVYLGYKLFDSPGGNAYQKGISIPKEYFQMGKILDDIKEETKVLSLPIDDGYSYKNWGYKGSSLINWLTKKPLIHSASGSVNTLTENQRLLGMSTEEACSWTASHNVDYILHEKDSLDNFPDNKLPFPSDIMFENNYFILRKIKKECVSPLIYIPDVPVNISFKKINPTKYFVEINGAHNPYTLVLSENYHRGWKVFIKNQSLPDDRHFLVNGYANGWRITPEDGRGEKNYTLVIEYWPQQLFYIGAIISILTTAFCVISKGKNERSEFIYGLKKSVK